MFSGMAVCRFQLLAACIQSASSVAAVVLAVLVAGLTAVLSVGCTAEPLVIQI